MKTKFKKNGRRLLAAILCLVMAVMALPMSAFAWTSEEGVSCTSSFGDYYVGSDGGYYRSKSSYSFIVYDSDGNTSVRTISAGNAKRKYLMTDSSGTHQVYCVESGIDFNTGNSYVSKNGKNSSYFRKLPTEAQFGVMMALMYGWHEGKSSPVAGTNKDDYAFATQTIIWEYQQQLRTSPSDLHSANGIDADTYCYSLKGRPAEKCYDWILSQMASHYTIPSFAARNQNKADTYTLKYNPDKQNYSLTLTDTNNTLANLSLSASGIKVSRSGNQYTFTSDKMITSPITVSAQKAVNLDCDEMLIWGCVGKQTMVSGASDPVYFYFKLDTETYGTGLIKKTSEDGVVSGIKFNISGNGVNQTVVTKADGTVDISLMPGVYTVTEQPIDRYEPQSVQRITIVNSVSFADGKHYHDNKANLRLLRQRSDELCREYALSVIEHPSGKKKPYALYQAEKQGRPTRDNVARQAVDEAIAQSYTLKDFDRIMAEMGYRVSFDPNRKYWTIIGKGWQRPKRLYKLGEDYTNDRITERISQNSYAVRLDRFTDPPKQVKVYRVKGSLSDIKKIGGLRGLYLHYCYQLGILPKNKKQNYARLHYLLKDDLMKMEAIAKETRLLCRNHIDTAQQLLSYKGSLETEVSALLEKRKELYSKSRSAKDEDTKSQVKSELSDISKRLSILRKEVKLCEGIAARSDTLKEKLAAIRADEQEQQRKELTKNEHRRRSGRTNRPNELGGL